MSASLDMRLAEALAPFELVRNPEARARLADIESEIRGHLADVLPAAEISRLLGELSEAFAVIEADVFTAGEQSVRAALRVILGPDQ